MDSGKKKVIEAYHIMERKALKMGAPSIRTARAARPTKPCDTGNDRSCFVFNEVEKMTSWQVQHGVIMEGACGGFKKACLFFYLSCFKFALVRI